jgi:polyhydroxyalkanoate synthase
VARQRLLRLSEQSYLLAAQYLEELVETAELEPKAKERARFAAKQWIDAICPANFPATNPDALRAARDTNGESLARGLANLLGDMQKRRISQTNEAAFEVGRNLAVTPGEVVYENELIQLIQYKATTAQVAKRPLVMIPPCINKFYILDLQPENSFVAYAVASGNTVFMVSWRNVEEEQGKYSWDDYLEQGVFQALRVAQEISKSDDVNALGFCVGGTLLGAALAVLAHRKDQRVASATFLAAMLDFSETGQIGLFVDEASVAAREATIGAGGILPGRDLAFVFSSLRANDLVWPYVVNNYLLGGEPAAFDLLYWNSDSTRMPAATHRYYLRNMYQKNLLKEPGGLTLLGTPIDLRQVTTPVFLISAREDHIAPWRNTYAAAGLYAGPVRFVLAGSGHIAGVINPAGSTKYGYCTNEALPADPDAWLEGAQAHPGSWWPAWAEWVKEHAGGKVKARVPGAGGLPALEEAPGSYVKIEA